MPKSYSTRMLRSSDDAPEVTEKFAICQVCGSRWAIRSGTDADTEGCSFCDAPAEAVIVISEHPDYSGRVVK